MLMYRANFERTVVTYPNFPSRGLKLRHNKCRFTHIFRRQVTLRNLLNVEAILVLKKRDFTFEHVPEK